MADCLNSRMGYFNGRCAYGLEACNTGCNRQGTDGCFFNCPTVTETGCSANACPYYAGCPCSNTFTGNCTLTCTGTPTTLQTAFN